MALLTAEDVLNKAFSKTKYREGFDQDEVDDFLDEVANTIAALTAERDDLAQRLQNAGGGMPVEAPPVTAAGGVPGTSGLLAAATDPNAPNPTGMLAMAQKLHDEYVQAGEAERDRLIEEGKVKAEQIVERAEVDARARMDDLAGERQGLEAKIDDLRRFERDYRARLRAHLENLLGDLDHAQGAAGAAVVAGAVAADDVDGWDEPVVEAAYEVPVDESVTEVETEPEAAVETEAESYEEPAAEYEEEPAPAAAQPFSQEPAPVQPAYDPTQPWESQLAQPEPPAPVLPPFAPVNPETPGVEPASNDEAPYTPPSTRMFNDLYGQQGQQDGR